MKDKKVIFMGTPSFAVPVLNKLIENTNVIMVVCQPDKEKDRKGNILPTPTKKIALENNIEVFQPKNIKESYEKIISLNPDINMLPNLIKWAQILYLKIDGLWLTVLNNFKVQKLMQAICVVVQH